MTVANWKTQPHNVVQSLLFNNPNRVIEYHIRGADGEWVNRADVEAPVTRLYEKDAGPDRTCLRTVQFVHHMMIPPGGRHVAELHIHPDAEELVVITRGEGVAIVDGASQPVKAEDVVYIPPRAEHEIQNTGDDFLGVLFINVPAGDGLRKLQQAQSNAAE